MVGERIKRLRKGEKLSQEKFGKTIGVSKVAISHYEKGISYPQIEHVIKMCEVYHVDANYLFGHDVDVIHDDDQEFPIKMSREDVKIIQELKSHRELYNYICEDPIRRLEQIRKMLKK